LTHVVLPLSIQVLVWMLTSAPVVVPFASSTATSASVIIHSSVVEVASVSISTSLVVHVASGLLLAIISLVAVILTAFFPKLR
jgi:hypothetical protein